MPHKSRDTYGRRLNVRKRNRAGRIADIVMLLLTVAATILLLCAYMGRSISPETAGFFALAGLGAPILYVANIILALYWIIRWRWFAFIPIAAAVIGVGWVSLYFRPSLSKHYSEKTSKTTLVMTYNVAGFIGDGGSGSRSTLDSIGAFVREVRPDILCIQEFQCAAEERKPLIDSLIGLPHNRVNYKLAYASGGGWGTAIYTRFRIVDWGTVDFGHTTNSAMWADLATGADTIRVFNCHLQTTSIDRADREYIINHEFFDSEESAEHRMKSMAAKLWRNFRIRAGQAEMLAPMIEASPYKVIVCGDFNDTPISYAYRTVRGDLADTFVEKGSGTPNTYRGLFNLFRIDYILHSRSIKTATYTVPETQYSDHKPVISGLEIN